MGVVQVDHQRALPPAGGCPKTACADGKRIWGSCEGPPGFDNHYLSELAQSPRGDCDGGRPEAVRRRKLRGRQRPAKREARSWGWIVSHRGRVRCDRSQPGTGRASPWPWPRPGTDLAAGAGGPTRLEAGIPGAGGASSMWRPIWRTGSWTRKVVPGRWRPWGGGLPSTTRGDPAGRGRWSKRGRMGRIPGVGSFGGLRLARRRRGVDRPGWGRIINVGSVCPSRGNQWRLRGRPSTAGRLTRSLANDWARHGCGQRPGAGILPHRAHRGPAGGYGADPGHLARLPAGAGGAGRPSGGGGLPARASPTCTEPCCRGWSMAGLVKRPDGERRRRAAPATRRPTWSQNCGASASRRLSLAA